MLVSEGTEKANAALVEAGVNQFIDEIAAVLTATPGSYTDKPSVVVTATNGTEMVIVLTEHCRDGIIVPRR